MPFHPFVLCLWMSRRIFPIKTKGSFGSQIDIHKTSDPWVFFYLHLLLNLMNFSSPMDPMGHRIAGVHALSIQFGRGVKWGSDAPGLWRIACHLHAFFWPRQDRADYYARKGIQVRQAVTLWEVKTDVACPIKMEKALHNNQMRDTNKVCKDDFFWDSKCSFSGV